MSSLARSASKTLSQKTTAELRDELARALKVTADSLAYLALVWRELEQRGENLDDLRVGLGRYLAPIADGSLAAEAVVMLAGHQTALDAMARLPIDEQRRIVAAGRVDVVRPGNNGPRVVSAPLISLRANEVARVFDGASLASAEKQKRALAKQTRKPTRKMVIELPVEVSSVIKTMARAKGVTSAELVSSIVVSAMAAKDR